MNKNANDYYVSPSQGHISETGMLKDIAGFVSDDSDSFYRLVIGTDSQIKRLNGVSECDYVTAIIIHRIGEGARYYWRKQRIKAPKVLRDKIYHETMLSLETAQALVPQVRKLLSPSKYDLEIHIDVGLVGPTREMIREVVGMVTGNGYVAKTKPESWGASSVADKYT